MLFTFKGTYNGQGTNPEFPIMLVLGDPSKCGENHYFVDIPHDISFFEFMEMNFETENGKIKPFKTARLDGKFKKRVDNFNYEKFIWKVVAGYDDIVCFFDCLKILTSYRFHKLYW